jgi:anti-sigma factor RsiW
MSVDGRCSRRWEEISALLDGELEPQAELDLRRHLDSCEVCAGWRAYLRALSQAAAGAHLARAPSSLVRRVREMAPRGRSWSTFGGTAAALGLVAAVGLWLTQAAGDRLEEAILSDHHRLVAGGMPLHVRTSEPAVLRAALSSRLPFEVDVGVTHDAALVGGRACSLAGVPAAYLQFERGGEVVSVFAYRTRGSPRPAATRCEDSAGERVCVREAPEETVVVVASRAETASEFAPVVRLAASR